MKLRKLISVLAILLTPITIYLVIVRLQDRQYDKQLQSTFYSVTDCKDFQPYRPKNTQYTNSQDFNFNLIEYKTPRSLLPELSSYKQSKNGQSPLSYTTLYNYNQEPTKTSILSLNNEYTGGVSMLLKGKSNSSANLAQSFHSSSSFNQIEMLNSKPIWFESQESFNQNGDAGLLDPGGFLDDEDENIHFIPVPDGMWFMLLLLCLYAVATHVPIMRQRD